MSEKGSVKVSGIWAKLGGRLLLLGIPLFLLSAYIWNKPMDYMDVEYALWQEEKDFVRGVGENGNGVSITEDPDILVIGDSRAKSSIIPKELTDRSIYNMAIGGATSLEMYYALDNYLRHHRAPEQVIIIFAPCHLCTIDNWQQNQFFNYLGLNELLETEIAAIKYNEPTIAYPGAFGDLLSFRLRLPNKYLDQAYQAKFSGNRAANLEKYASVRHDLGYTEFGTEDGNDGLNYETRHPVFDYSPFIRYYYDRLLKLCESHGIAVTIEQAPINEASAAVITDEFWTGYRDYMESIAKEHPDFNVVIDIPVYKNRYFGDNNHMNRSGAEVFTAEIKPKYSFLES